LCNIQYEDDKILKLRSFTIAEMELPDILPDVIPEEKKPLEPQVESDDYYEEDYEECIFSVIALH